MDLNSTILGQVIAFFLFIWFCMKYIWPNLIQIIEKRKILIKKKLDDIKNKEKKLHEMYLQAKNEIDISKKKAIRIINEANKQKFLILEESKINAKKEKEIVIIQAKKMIKLEKIKARKKLIKEVSILATLMANKIILNTLEKKDNIHNLEKIVNTL